MESEEDAKDTLLDVKLKKRTFRGQPVKGGLKSVSMVRSFYPVMASPVLPAGVYPGMQYPPPYGVVPNGGPMPPMHYGYGIIPGTVNAGMHLNLGGMPGDEPVSSRQPHSPGSDGGEAIFNKAGRGGEGRRMDRGASGMSNKTGQTGIGAPGGNGQSFSRENRGERGDRNKSINPGIGGGVSGKTKGEGGSGSGSSGSSSSSGGGGGISSGGSGSNSGSISSSGSGVGSNSSSIVAGSNIGTSNSNSVNGNNNTGNVKQGRGKGGNDSRRDGGGNSGSPLHGDKSQSTIEINSANFPPLHGGQGAGLEDGPIPVPGYKGAFTKYSFDDIINIVKDVKEAVIPSSIRPENHPLAMTSTPNLDLLQRQRTFSIDETREQLRQGRPVQREAVIAGAVDYGSMMYGDDKESGAGNSAATANTSSGGSATATTEAPEVKKTSGGSWAAIASVTPPESAVIKTTTTVKKTTTAAQAKTDDKAGAGAKDGAKKQVSGAVAGGSGDKKKSERSTGGGGGGGRREGGGAGGAKKGEGGKVRV